MMVYVVLVEADDGYTTQIHSVYSSKEAAEDTASRLQSQLDDMIVVVEEHEVQS